MTRRTPVIIDTDPGVDDIFALLLALASPELEIVAIVPTFGNTTQKNARVNLLKVYAVLEEHFAARPEDRARFVNFDAKPFIVDAANGPLEGEELIAAYFDGLSDITDRHPDIGKLPETPDVFAKRHFKLGSSLADVISSRPARSITYLSLGPFSTLARLLQTDKDLLLSHIGQVISMGGAVDVPGNTSPVAEFNVFADPFAFHALLHSGLGQSQDAPPWLILPLDITTQHVLPFASYRDNVDADFSGTPSKPSVSKGKSPLLHLSSSVLERTAEVMSGFGLTGFELHDPLAVFCAIENAPGQALAPGWKTERRPFDVERGGHLTRGMLVVDRRGSSQTERGANRAKDGLTRKPQIQQNGQVPKEVTDYAAESGFQIVVDTPGAESLRQLMFRRIWGHSA